MEKRPSTRQKSIRLVAAEPAAKLYRSPLSSIDLFCGAGGITQGFRQAGYHCLYANDLMPEAIETFRHNHPTTLAECKSIEEVNAHTLRRTLGIQQGDLDVLVGGPPCQGFFAALEVQTMDTIGSYRAERSAILDSHPYTGKSVGPNWENVNKRILPQLIYKGHLLEREALCQSGLFFVCPEAVYNKIMDRLGSTLADYPLKNNSLTFVPIRLNPSLKPGIPRAIEALRVKTTTVQQVQIAFSSPTNLPESGAYEKAIRAALGEARTA